MFDWLRKLIKKKSKQTLIEIKPAGVEPPTPQPKVPPTVYRITYTYRYIPPAERHRATQSPKP